MIDTLGKPLPWPTAVHSLATASTVRDLKAIGDNFAQCRACQGRWFTLYCAVDALSRFLAPRLITTVVAVAAVCAVVAALA